jgi:drug/metabolite transporter (DMT)-like permease
VLFPNPVFLSETTLVQTKTTPKPASQSAGGSGSGPGSPRPPVGGAVLGLVYANCAVFLFTVMDAVIKSVAQTFPTGEIIFFRNIFAFIPLLAFALWRHGGVPLKTAQPWGHVMRGVFGVASMFCFFLSYKLMPLSDAIALGLSGPIFITVLSVPILGEHVGWRRWSAVIVGFIGVLVMTRPGSTLFDIHALVPLAAAVLYAVAMISIRKLGATEPSTTIVFHFTMFATLASLLTIPWGMTHPEQAWVMPGGWQWLVLIIIGTLGGMAQIVMTMAYQRARAATVASFDYTALVYAFILGAIFFHERPDIYLIVGGLIVVAAGIYIIHRETVVARQQHRDPPIPPLPPNE